MFLLSKLLPLLILPLGISLILLICKIVFKVKGADIVALGVLYFSSIGIVSERFINLIEQPWQRLKASDIEKSDAIVVLSGGGKVLAPSKHNFFEWSDPDRFLAGIELFKNSKAPKLVFTGGAISLSKKTYLEGDLYIKEAIKYGIPRNAIYSTPKVLNTLQESIEISRLLIKDVNHRPQKIILVTSAFHMKRAKRNFERKGFIVYPFPVDFKSSNKVLRTSFKHPLNWVPSVENLSKTSLSLRELLGRILYKIN